MVCGKLRIYTEGTKDKVKAPTSMLNPHSLYRWTVAIPGPRRSSQVAKQIEDVCKCVWLCWYISYIPIAKFIAENNSRMVDIRHFIFLSPICADADVIIIIIIIIIKTTHTFDFDVGTYCRHIWWYPDKTAFICEVGWVSWSLALTLKIPNDKR